MELISTRVWSGDRPRSCAGRTASDASVIDGLGKFSDGSKIKVKFNKKTEQLKFTDANKNSTRNCPRVSVMLTAASEAEPTSAVGPLDGPGHDLAAASTIGLLVVAAMIIPEARTTSLRITAARYACVSGVVWVVAGLVAGARLLGQSGVKLKDTSRAASLGPGGGSLLD